MKKTILYLFFIGTPFCLMAQNGKKMNTNHTNIIKIGTATYFSDDDFPFAISWETKIANKQSLQFGISPRLLKNDYENKKGIAVSAAYRYYISKGREGLQGLYLSPGVKFGTFKNKFTYTQFDYTNPMQPTYSNKEGKSTNTSINVFTTFGKHWVYKSGFSLDIGVGLGYYNNQYKDDVIRSINTPYPYVYYKPGNTYGIDANFAISIGYAF